MPDQPQPPPSTAEKPADPAVYGGQWGEGDQKKPGVPPPDSPDKIKPPPEKT